MRSKTVLTLSDAQSIAMAARAEANRRSWAVRSLSWMTPGCCCYWSVPMARDRKPPKLPL